MKSKPERTSVHSQRLKSRSHRCCRTIHLSYTLVAQTFPSSVWELALLHIFYSENLYYCTFCTEMSDHSRYIEMRTEALFWDKLKITCFT